MTYLMLEILGALLIALLLGWWSGSRLARWQSKRMADRFEAQINQDRQAQERLSREVDAAKTQFARAMTEREAAEARTVDINSQLLRSSEALAEANARVEKLEGELNRERRMLTLSGQALGALQGQYDKSINTLEQVRSEAAAKDIEDEARQLELERLQREREALHDEARSNLKRLKELETDILNTLSRTADLPVTPGTEDIQTAESDNQPAQ